MPFRTLLQPGYDPGFDSARGHSRTTPLALRPRGDWPRYTSDRALCRTKGSNASTNAIAIRSRLHK